MLDMAAPLLELKDLMENPEGCQNTLKAIRTTARGGEASRQVARPLSVGVKVLFAGSLQTIQSLLDGG